MVDRCINVDRSFFTKKGPCSLNSPKREDPPGPPWSQRRTGAVSGLNWNNDGLVFDVIKLFLHEFWKMYTALGFEPTPFRPWVFPLTTRPGQVFTASVFGNHSTRLLPLPERTRRTGLSRTWRSRQSGSRSSFRSSPSVRGTPDERRPISAPSWCSRLESSE